MNFDNWFDNSVLPKILSKAKTIDKKECKEIYNYFVRKKPKRIFEFGVQYGCSTRFFLELSEFLKLPLELHSFDISNNVKYADPEKFKLHIKDITTNVDETFNELGYPDLVFLDAHPYKITKNLMNKCLNERIDFMAHDVSQKIGRIRASKRTNNFTNFSIDTGAEWELYTLCELISKDLWNNDNYMSNDLQVKIITGRYGLGIVEHKEKENDF